MKLSLKPLFIKNILLFSAAWICALMGCVSKTNLSFERFKEIERQDTSVRKGVQLIKKEEYYLVTGYKKNKKADAQIDSFYCAVKDPNPEKYYTYWVHFLKKSKKTSKEYFHGYERGFYTNLGYRDRIVSYRTDNRRHSNTIQIDYYKEICKGNQYPVKTGVVLL